jgi:hypothetical protein
MKNKLTLKSLQQELKRMKLESNSKVVKTNKNTTPSDVTNTKSGIGHNIKDSIIQRLYMRSSSFTLFLLTGILGYVHKVPMIRKLLAVLGFWYGKTTIWKLLVKIRKAFILVNAAIGVYMVFKTVGFSSDNILAGVGGMGHTYYELLFNTTKRLFNWFVELFDHKLVPNIPSEKPSYFPRPFKLPWSGPIENTWYTRPMQDYSYMDVSKFKDLYKNPFNITFETTPWYRDVSTILWIAGGIITIGTVYLGYKIYSDPSILTSIFLASNNPDINVTNPTPPQPGSSTGPGTPYAGDGEDIALNGNYTSPYALVSKNVVNIYKFTINKLNPFNWFVSVSETESQLRTFMDIQNDYNRSNRTLYPFTNNNPYDSWLKRLRMSWFGETRTEFTERNFFIEHADRVYNELKLVGKGKSVEKITSGWTTPTPLISTIGLPLPQPFNPFGLVEALNAVEASNTTAKLEAIPSTPKVIVSPDAWIKTPEVSATDLNQRLVDLKTVTASTSSSSTSSPELDTIPIDKTMD